MNTPLAAVRRFAVATTTTALALAGAGMSPATYALGLGNIEVLSGLNQPLRAVVPLLLEEEEFAHQLSLAIARDDEASKFGALPNLLGQEVDVVLSLQGDRTEALITTKYPVKEPHLDVVLHAKVGETKHLRIYPVLLDLPLAFFEPDDIDDSHLSDIKQRSAWNGEPSEQQAEQMSEPAEVAKLDLDGEATEPFSVGSLPPPATNDDAFDETVSFIAAREDDIAQEREISDNEISAIELRDDAAQVGEARETAVVDATFAERAEDAFRAAAETRTNVEIEIEDNEVYAAQITEEAEFYGLAKEDAVKSSEIPDDVWGTADAEDDERLREMQDTEVFATQLTPEAQNIGLPLVPDDESDLNAEATPTAQTPVASTVTVETATAPDVTPANVEIEDMDFRVDVAPTPAATAEAAPVVPADLPTIFEDDIPAAQVAPVEVAPAPTDDAIEEFDFRIKPTATATPDTALDTAAASVTAPEATIQTASVEPARVNTLEAVEVAAVEVEDTLGAPLPRANFDKDGMQRVMPAMPVTASAPAAATPDASFNDAFSQDTELASWAGTDAHLPLPEAVLVSEVPDDLGAPLANPALPRSDALRVLTQDDTLTD